MPISKLSLPDRQRRDYKRKISYTIATLLFRRLPGVHIKYRNQLTHSIVDEILIHNGKCQGELPCIIAQDALEHIVKL